MLQGLAGMKSFLFVLWTSWAATCGGANASKAAGSFLTALRLAFFEQIRFPQDPQKV